MDLSDKVVLITGGGSGIGRETAILFSKEDARVYVCDKREEPLKKLKDEFGIEYALGDVTKEDDINEILNTVFSYDNRTDILINNAGTFEHNLELTNTSEEQWDYVMNTNLKSVYLMSKAVLPYMIDKGQGSIINVGSIIASTGAPNAAAYIASKGGVIALTKSMAKDYAEYGIRVNSVSPSMIDTDMTRDIPVSVKIKIMEQHLIKRLGKPQEVAEAILYLAKAEWTTGLDLPVDGGVSLR